MRSRPPRTERVSLSLCGAGLGCGVTLSLAADLPPSCVLSGNQLHISWLADDRLNYSPIANRRLDRKLCATSCKDALELIHGELSVVAVADSDAMMIGQKLL